MKLDNLMSIIFAKYLKMKTTAKWPNYKYTQLDGKTYTNTKKNTVIQV